jgi:methionyl aminopeptidase
MSNKNQYQMVHGIPKEGETLYDGCIVKFDLGATYKRAIADSAISCIYGEPKSQRHIDLLKDTRDALMKGIASIKIGNPIGSIGHAIYKHGLDKRYGVITQYGGHGLGWSKPHDFPFISNRAEKTDGVRVCAGLSIAIEPMFVIDDETTKTWVANDGWTVNSFFPTAHWEHSVFVHSNGDVEIMTLREGEII